MKKEVEEEKVPLIKGSKEKAEKAKTLMEVLDFDLSSTNTLSDFNNVFKEMAD